MNKIFCKVCGSADIVKENGKFICKHCGAQYNLDEVKLLIDNGHNACTEDNATEKINAINSMEEKKSSVDDSILRKYSDDEEFIDDYMESKKAKKIIALMVIFVIAIFAILTVYNRLIVPPSKYSTAVELLEKGKYSESYELFDELGDYKDAATQKNIALEYLQQEHLKQANVEDIVAFGRYYWIVLDREELANGAVKLFMLSKDCVAEGDFNSIDKEIAWKDSSVRRWLNNKFYNQFTEKQKKIIALSEVENISNSRNGIVDYGTTEDYFFLLSTKEVGDYLFNSNYRSASYEGDDVWWWLRTPSSSGKYVSYMWNKGDINDAGLQPQTIYTMGIRPAMNVIIGGKLNSKDENEALERSDNGKEKDDYIEAYGKEIKSLNAELSDTDNAYFEYALYDIDDDGIPEMILHLGTCEADSEYRVYRVQEGKALLAGVIYGGNGYLAGLDEEKAVLFVSAYMGYESVDRISLNDGKITQTNIFEGEVPPEEDYTNFVELKMKPIESDNDNMSWTKNTKSGNDALLNALL